MDKLSIVRSAYHTNAGHGMGSHWMLTGYRPTIEINDNINPSDGSIVAKMRGPTSRGLPAYVSLPQQPASARPPTSASPTIRSRRAAIRISAELPGPRPEAARPRVDPVASDTPQGAAARTSTPFAATSTPRATAAGSTRFYREAFEMVTTPKCRRAFDIQQGAAQARATCTAGTPGPELPAGPPAGRGGRDLRDRQPAAAGTRTSNNFRELKTNLLPQFDQAVAALVEDLHERGLQDEVLVVAYGRVRPDAADQQGRRPRPLARAPCRSCSPAAA